MPRYPFRSSPLRSGMALAFVVHPAFANAAARVPVITGNGWVALGIIGVLVGVIYMLIKGALHIEDRDARFSGGRRSRDDDGWFGFFPHNADDDDDGHGFHHHDGGAA